MYPNYAPPGYGPSRRGPGGLPTNQASLDIRAFIPAQYDHLQIHPAGVMAAIAVGVTVILLVRRNKEKI